MKAALTADLLTLYSYFRRFALMCLALGFVVSFLMGNSPVIVAFWGVIVPIAMGTGLSQYDKARNWQGYRLALPLTRMNVVLGRYATLLILSLAGVAIGILCYLAACAITPLLPPTFGRLRSPVPLDGSGLILASAIGVTLALLMASVTLPISLRFSGNTPGFVTAGVMVAVMLAFNLLAPLHLDWAEILPFAHQVLELLKTPLGMTLTVGASLALACIPYAISAFIAVRLYEKREF